MEAWWISLGALTMAAVVWFVKITWALRGVSDMSEAAMSKALLMMPRTECELKEATTAVILKRIDDNVSETKTTLDRLDLATRMTKLEIQVEHLQNRSNVGYAAS